MKTIAAYGTFNRLVGLTSGLAFLTATLPLWAQPAAVSSITGASPPGPVPAPITLTAKLSATVKPYTVLTAMQRVADWQLAHPAGDRPTGWVEAVGDAGMMALAGISGDPKYREAMRAKGEANNW